MGKYARKRESPSDENPAQRSLFESHEALREDSATVIPLSSVKKPTMIDLLRDRLENDAIAQEDYKKWIRFLVQNSFKSIK